MQRFFFNRRKINQFKSVTLWTDCFLNLWRAGFLFPLLCMLLIISLIFNGTIVCCKLYRENYIPFTFPFWFIVWTPKAFQVVLVLKNPPAKAGGITDAGLISGVGRSPGRGTGTPFQISHLENPLDRGAWRATVHRVAKSWTQLKWLCTFQFWFVV